MAISMHKQCLFIILTTLIQRLVEAKVPAVIVFGDSSVDAGNNNQIPTIARANFEPYGRDFPGGKPTGRFSNGRVPTDFISQAFGLKPMVPAYLDPAYKISDFAVGVTFASAGSGYDTATSDVLVSTDVRFQISCTTYVCPSQCHSLIYSFTKYHALNKWTLC